MAELETSYSDGAVTTRTPGATSGGGNDMEFFRQMAMSALTPKRPQRTAPTLTAPGAGRNLAPVPSQAERHSSFMMGMEQRNAAAAAKNARHEANYDQQMRQFDLNGPRKMNLPGGQQMIGGFVEDRDSIPYSLRGKVDFANAPSDAIGGVPAAYSGLSGLNRPTQQQFAAISGQPDERADFFGTGTTDPQDQRAILQGNARQRALPMQNRR